MRKKIFTFLLALVTSVGLSWAQNPSGSCGENVTWELNTSTGALTITGSGAMEVYTSYYIPWKNYKSSITSVVITDGVTSVSQYSFSQCENLTSVTIGDDVETIGQFTFNDCGSSFTSLTIGNSVQSIGMAAFLNAKWITELTLPSTLQTIGSYALCNLTALSTITIPSSVTNIEASAFSGCTGLTSIYVEATTPPTMGNDVFANISGKAYIPLYVPNGSVAAYTDAAQWNAFNIQGYDPSDPGSGEEPGGDDPSTGDGSLSGAFTINAYGDQINFSKGNLQYVGSWQFAANQWDIIGAAQADDNRDLFGWGTGDAPNKVSMDLDDYAVYHEWGTNMGDGWYTLSRDEWTYLFQTRTNAANLYAPANVNGVNGFVVLPDEWTLPYGMTFTPGVTNYGTNVYQNAGWTAMEDAGAVFLPVAGYRYNGNVNWVGQSGYYWSSTVASEGASAWSWLISASSGARRDYYNLYYGMPVRLVKAVVKSDQEFADPVIALIEAIGTVEYTQVCKNRIVEARVAYDHLTDAQKALVSNYSTLTNAEATYASLTPPPATDGSLSGAFTINGDGDQINFSKANLQYAGSPATWKFAENQWDIIGAAQADDNRDLFGWGTGDAPNKVSMTLADYAEYHEWGTNMGNGWYTLSRDEWTYLFQSRTNAANLYAPANVNGVNGFVVLPDEWVQPYGTTFTPGVTNYGTNVYADAAWTSMEDAGAVFLPVAGYRYNGNVNWQGQSGFYWSSTVASEGASAWSWLISASDGARRDYYNLYYGMPVRLVKAASSTPANPTVQINGSWDWDDPWLTFTDDDGDGIASVTKELTASSTPYEFGLHINSAWATNGYAFHCGYTSVDNFAHDAEAGNMTLRADMSGVYTFTYTYATNTFSITFPKTTMKGSWDSWADAVVFTPNSNGESAWVTKNFTTEGYYTLKINAGDDDWRGKDVTLSRKNMSATGIATNAANITLYVDEPGDYSFRWTFASNTLELTWVPDATNKALTTKEDPKNQGVWYSTFYHSMNRFQLPAGVEAYVATVSGENLNLTKIAEAGQVLPENTAVILKADAENISLIPTDATPVSYSATNNLHGVDVVTEISAAVSGTCYVLSGNASEGVGFFVYEAPNQLQAHKAYIDLNGGTAQAPRRMRFVFETEQTATDLEEINTTSNAYKIIRDGQLIIIRNGVEYNVNGQEVK